MFKRKLIRNVRDLPGWFDIKKYAATKHLTAEQWSGLLLLRAVVDKRLRYKKGSKHAAQEMDAEIESIPADELMRSFHSHPLHIPVHHPHISRATKHAIARADSERSVEPLDKPLPGRVSPQANWASIRVNLDATDQQIIEDFKVYLTACRQDAEATPRDKNYTDNDAQKWHRNGVLPYLDLTIWARSENIMITQHVLGQAIFPDDFLGDPTDRIRRTTKPMAEGLQSKACFGVFYAQITSKIVAKNL